MTFYLVFLLTSINVLIYGHDAMISVSYFFAYTPEADPGSVKRGGRESKFLDAAPENNKNRPQKPKIGRKKRGAAADSAPPPPLDPPLHTMYNWNSELLFSQF